MDGAGAQKLVLINFHGALSATFPVLTSALAFLLKNPFNFTLSECDGMMQHKTGELSRSAFRVNERNVNKLYSADKKISP